MPLSSWRRLCYRHRRSQGRPDIEGQDTSVQNDTPGTSYPFQKGATRLDYRATPNPRTLLGHLDELTDEEVDSLLSDLFQEAEVEG
jgi:hypothetical protein